MYITMLQFYLPKAHIPLCKNDLDGSVDEKVIRAEGYGNGMLTVNKVKNIRYSKTEPDIILWDGTVEAGMSGGMLGKTGTNEILGMIVSYEPSKNTSRALSVHWIIEHFSELISPEDHVQGEFHHLPEEPFCTYHQVFLSLLPKA